MSIEQNSSSEVPEATHGSEEASPGPEAGITEEPAHEPAPCPADEPLEADLESLRAELEEVRASAAEHKDRCLRALAEVENTRRRAEGDVASARKFAVENFASELLAVRDSLDIARSLDIDEGDTSVLSKMKEGMDLTLRQLDTVFSKFEIHEVAPAAGDRLDPDKHQAVTTQESEEIPANHIVTVIQKGYTIHGRLLRPAMVVVARPAPQEKPSNQG